MTCRDKRLLTAILVASLCVITTSAPAEGTGTSAPGRHLPAAREASGIHPIRKHELLRYDSSTHYHLPRRYLTEVPEQRERKGLKEHLLIGVASSFNSQYVSRELPISKGPVWQPSASVELYGFGLNVWSNFVLNDEPNQGQFNEVDFTTYYTAHLGKLTLHPYFVFMVFPNADPASLDYSPAPIIDSSLYVQYNLGDFDLFGRVNARLKQTAGRVYANVGVGYNHLFPHDITLLTSALLNIGNSQYLSSHYGPTGTNIDALAFMLGASWKTHGVTLKPNINVALHVIPDIRRKIRRTPNLDTAFVWGGLDISYDF